jgi:RNA polymerase sigma-70 factor, ECF subfamily
MLEGVIEQTNPAKTMPTPAATSPSFDELFRVVYPKLVAILRRMLGDSGRAEEFASEAFLRLHRTTLPPSAKANVPGWLYRTAMHMGIDELRARTRRYQIDEKLAASENDHSQDDNALQQLLRTERQQRVRAVLANLKPLQSSILLLRAEGYSYKELARHLEVAPASVGTMLLRAEAAFEKAYIELFGSKE